MQPPAADHSNDVAAHLNVQVRRETEWLNRGPKARTTKATFRIEEAGRKKEELDELKFRNASARPEVSFVVDDLVSTDPWRPRMVAIHGTAEVLTEG